MSTTRPDPNPVPHDPWLAHALRHAPQPQHPPSAEVRAAVLAQARARLGSGAGASDPASSSESGWRRWLPWNWPDTSLLQWVGGVASVLVVVLAGVLWGSQERREEAMQEAVQVAAAPQVAPAAVPSAASVLDQVAKPDAAAAPLAGPPPTRSRELNAKSTQVAVVAGSAVATPATPAAAAAVAAAPPPQPSIAPPVTSAVAPAADNVMGGMAKSKALAEQTAGTHLLARSEADAARREAATAAMPAAPLAFKPATCQIEPEARPCNLAAVQSLWSSALWRSVRERGAPGAQFVLEGDAQALRWQGASADERTPERLLWMPAQRRVVWVAGAQTREALLNAQEAQTWQGLWDAVRQGARAD